MSIHIDQAAPVGWRQIQIAGGVHASHGRDLICDLHSDRLLIFKSHLQARPRLDALVLGKGSTQRGKQTDSIDQDPGGRLASGLRRRSTDKLPGMRGTTAP